VKRGSLGQRKKKEGGSSNIKSGRGGTGKNRETTMRGNGRGEEASGNYIHAHVQTGRGKSHGIRTTENDRQLRDFRWRQNRGAEQVSVILHKREVEWRDSKENKKLD